ncbi:hypothetical protein R7X45_01765 [Mesomycoplasma ovipneumoniae]|uniref:hypothetical protein n=1 Tax=Mesomycoplasma ovipneumoniae TaxID=29562 RepID=UPI00296487FB|nr:hypothetical protein [Mesomycoplasma ovipneumoniae]MDW2926322.1 hypothetical protein [Mesomycoplasma ovipneumoniae]
MKINNKNIKKIIGLSPLTNLTFASLLISVPVISVISLKNWHQKDSTSLAYNEEFNNFLDTEANNVISQLEQNSSVNFLNVQDVDQEARKIGNLGRFKKDFNNFINKVKANPRANLEKLAKDTLATKGINYDQLKKQYQRKVKMPSVTFSYKYKPQNRWSMGNVPFPWDPRKISFRRVPASGVPQNNDTYNRYSAGVWRSHVKTASFAAINFGLAVAYGFALNFVAAVSAGAAGSMLSYLSAKYKELYDQLQKAPFDISDKIKGQMASHANAIGIAGSVNKWLRGVLTLANSVRKIQTTVRPALLASSVLSNAGAIISLIDLTQGLISELIDRLVIIDN